MKAIHADPETIDEVFTKKFVIPNFQRPYSWDIDECDKLWDDLISFYNRQKSEKEQYFLGPIVTYPSEEQKGYKKVKDVIDGQQRLTTLLLLIKSFHKRANTFRRLERCLDS